MLKHLFKAEFADGSVIQQDQTDVSKLDATKSMFCDVLNHPSELVMFSLGDVLSLHLPSGQFRLNGNSFHVQDPSRPTPDKRKLIYFRTNTVHMNAGLEQVGTETEYHLGWQATVNGENVQHTVKVQ
jgi:hypothetical protein